MLAAVCAQALMAGLGRGGVRIVDVRPLREFMAAHIPGSISVPYAVDRFGTQVRSLLPNGVPAVLIAHDRPTAEAATVGLRADGHTVLGLLDGGVEAWTQAGHPLEHVREWQAEALSSRLATGGIAVLDVREPGEWAGGVIAGAICMRLAEIPTRFSELDPAGEYVAVCAIGVRSLRAAWLLQQRGFARVANLLGGMKAWVGAGLPSVPPPAAEWRGASPAG